ncbi:unnamed protein product, partial [Rotaria magnacalcarata]
MDNNSDRTGKERQRQQQHQYRSPVFKLLRRHRHPSAVSLSRMDDQKSKNHDSFISQTKNISKR